MSNEDKKIVRPAEGGKGAYAIFCPGCKNRHVIYTEGPTRWTFNSDPERPTFRPSLLMTWTSGDPPVTAENFDEYKKNPWPQTDKHNVCHSFITDGQIQFLDDCTHELKGKTVPLQPF